MEDDSLSSSVSDSQMSPSSDYSIDYWTIYFFSLYTGFAFQMCFKRACYRPLHRHGVPTVGVVQSSRTAQNAFMHTSYFVTFVFPTYQIPLAVKHHESEVYVSYGEKNTTTMEQLGDWKSTLVKKECQVSSDVYNEVIRTNQVKMLFDPKSPLDAIPECMVKQPSNCSLFGSFLYDAFLFLFVTCILMLWGNSLLTFFQSDWTIRQLLISIMVVIIGFFLGSNLFQQTPAAHKGQNHLNCKDDATSILDDVKLEEIAAANSLVLHNQGRVLSNDGYAGRSLHMSTKAGEVC